jgi:hypothetical protein
MNRYLICGDRHWANWDNQTKRYLGREDVAIIGRIVASLPHGSVVIEGEAKGADELARLWAQKLGVAFEAFPAHWQHTYKCPKDCPKIEGRKAGSDRNTEMLEVGCPDVVIWCHHNLPESIGTRNMVKQAMQAKVPVFSFEEWLTNHPE